ncbi:MAG: CCA tRNA nucleotidyltransferase [Chloroflexota bacterium]|nr:CCA tRNA nucleotidyltransferase [Chloroflexota bacterium]
MNPLSDGPSPGACALTPIESLVDRDNLPLYLALKELASELGLSVFLVGGPVRDWLLGLRSRDLDFVVEGDAAALARTLADRVGGRVTSYSKFGTATVALGSGHLDLVTARREVYPFPGSLPEVEPSNLADDLARRDFTINAMALHLEGGDPMASLVDPLGGQEDLRLGRIRTIHSQSFQHDPTRLFRALKYEQRLGFGLEEGTGKQFQAAVAGKYCDTVSGDRIRRELEKSLEEKDPAKPILRALETGLLASVFPALVHGEQVGRLAAATLDGEFEVSDPISWIVALAYPLSTGEAEGLIGRLNMPGGWARAVREAVRLRHLEPALNGPGMASSELNRKLGDFDIRTVAVAARITGQPEVARNLERFLEEYGSTRPVLNGNDLLEMGVPPGPAVGRALASLRDLRIDRKINTEEEEREWVRGMVSSKNYWTPRAT